MSVDISQLTARLDPERQEAVKAQYEERATNPTATFLLCFFLGSAGAHRFYLREWRVAFAHLTLFILGAAALVAGLVQTLPLTTQLVNHPLGFALDVLGVVLLLASLIWEIIDLGRIDHQVYQRNLLLAEGIIAATLLADQSVIEGARHKLDDVVRQTQAHTAAAATATAAAAATAATVATAVTDAPQYGSSGVITASEVADARALAEETGAFSTISYAEVSRFDVSEDPDQARQASADAAREGSWAESVTASETFPAASADAAPTTVSETVTRTHIEDGPHVTDSYEVDRAAGPSTEEVVGLGAAGLGAAALGAGVLESAAHGDFHSAGFDEPTQPDYAISATPEAMPEAAFADAAEAPAAEPATDEPVTAAYTAAYTDDGYDFDDDDLGDVTDASMPAVVIPAADIAIGNASPAYVRLPDEEPAAEEPAAPLYLVPDEPEADVYPYAPEPVESPTYESPTYESPTYEPPTYESPAYEPPTYEPPTSVEPPADAYVPPVASVYSQAPEAPVTPTPSWDQPTFAQPAPEPVAQEPVAQEPASTQPDTLAELAGFAGLAGAGALAGEALAHSHAAEPAPAEPVAAEPAPAEPAPAEPAPAEPAPAEPAPVMAAAEPAMPEAPKMKKIRVRRKVVVDGQVVAEEVVEREVPADMDTATAAAQIQAELSHLTPEQIAQRAHLSPGEEIELRQRTEGPSAEE